MGDIGGGAGGATAYGVSDEVWRVIEGEGARAAAGERRALLKATAIVAALTVGTAGLLLSGVVTARLSGGNAAGGGGGGKGDPYHVEFTLHNDGITPVDVVRWTSRIDGVVVEGASPATIHLSPRGTQGVMVTFRTTDCAVAVPQARAGLETISGSGLGVVIDRPWGDMESVVHPVMAVEDLVLGSCGVESPWDPDPTDSP